ncbi:hypothetical protein NKG05_28970 [Oerskovia sp. M15]
MVSTNVLQRRLAGDSGTARRGARGLEDLIARRRKARTEGQTGPVDLRAFQDDYRRSSADATFEAPFVSEPWCADPLSREGPS